MSRNFVRFVAVMACVVLGVVGEAQAAFIPTNVAGLTSWVNPSSIVGLTNGTVVPNTGFADSANAGITWGAINKYGTARPTYNTNVFGTQPGLTYAAGNDLEYGTSANVFTSTTYLDAFAVVNVTTTTTKNGAIFGNEDATMMWEVAIGGGEQFRNSVAGTFVTSPGGVLTYNTAHILELTFNAGAVTEYVDGTIVMTGTAGESVLRNTERTGDVTLGLPGYNNGPEQFVGSMGDLLFYNTVLSATDRGNVGAYLQTKDGIPGAYVGTGVPEPGTLALLAAGLAGLLCYAWRKRK